MIKVSGGPEAVGESAAVTLLDWCDLGNKVLLVMERPDPCMDLNQYVQKKNRLDEDQAKVLKCYKHVSVALYVSPKLQ